MNILKAAYDNVPSTSRQGFHKINSFCVTSFFILPYKCSFCNNKKASFAAF